MIDPVKILQRALNILWNYRTLWLFGLILALAAGGSSGARGNSSMRYHNDENNRPVPQSMQQFFHDPAGEIQKLLHEGIPGTNISGKALTTFLWVVGIFIVIMLIVGIAVTIARYVSETAVIRMVDEYETTSNKVTLRQGWRIGWSRTSWRLFLINLIVSLPAIAGLLVVILVTAASVFSIANNHTKFSPLSLLFLVGSVILIIFLTAIVTILLRLLRHFFWRISVLEDVSVSESLRRGVALVRENWKSVGLMWLVMIGLAIVWAVAAVILIIVTIPVVIVTVVIAALVVALPYLLFVGIFSTFLSGALP